MKTEIIKAIFTNLLFVIGVILIIFGFSKGVMVGVRLVVFDKYPVNSYEESRCDMVNFSTPVVKGVDEVEQMSDEEREQQRQRCLASVEYQRKIKLTEDVVTSITTLLSGGVLVYFFRKFIFGKK